MKSEQYVLLVPREDEKIPGKTHWLKIGRAYPQKKEEDGLSCTIDAIPVGNWNGKFIIIPKDKWIKD